MEGRGCDAALWRGRRPLIAAIRTSVAREQNEAQVSDPVVSYY